MGSLKGLKDFTLMNTHKYVFPHLYSGNSECITPKTSYLPHSITNSYFEWGHWKLTLDILRIDYDLASF